LYCVYVWICKSPTDDEHYERQLVTIKEVFVFQIPPQQSAAGHRAADWPKNHNWEGRLDVVAKGDDAAVKLIDKNGQLFAAAPVVHDGPEAVTPVTDSSRYFVLRIVDAASGKHAFIGIAFNAKADAFDFNVALADHKKQVEREIADKEAGPTDTGPVKPALDMSFKEGEKIVVKIKSKKGSKKKASSGTSTGLLAPPPGSKGLLAPPPSRSRRRPGGGSAMKTAQGAAANKVAGGADLLGGMASMSVNPAPAPAPAADPFAASDPFAPAPAPAASDDPFAGFG
jgi:hypothetical protein